MCVRERGTTNLPEAHIVDTTSSRIRFMRGVLFDVFCVNMMNGYTVFLC